MSNWQLNKSKSVKKGTEAILNLSSNLIGDSNDENNFLHRLLLLTDSQVLMLCEAYAINL